MTEIKPNKDIEYVHVVPRVFTPPLRRAKTLTERLNEAYRDDNLEPEEREFLELTREHFSRLDDE
jgi:hypothetical protein